MFCDVMMRRTYLVIQRTVDGAILVTFFPRDFKRAIDLRWMLIQFINNSCHFEENMGVSSDLEIPMEYFAYAIENALKIYGAHGEQSEWITSQQWLDAIKLSGYIESEHIGKHNEVHMYKIRVL